MLLQRKNIIKSGLISVIQLVVFWTSLSFAFANAQKPSDYIKKYRIITDSLEKSYGIPSTLILSVAIIESGYGKSRNAKLLNNHFGIVGKNNLLSTHGIKSKYRQYESIEGSYIHFCKVLASKKYYGNLKGNKDCDKWINAMKNSGYSEKPDVWAPKIKTMVRQLQKSK